MYNLGKGLNGKILGNSLPQLKKKKEKQAPRHAQQPELGQDHATGTVLLECHHSVAASGHTT